MLRARACMHASGRLQEVPIGPEIAFRRLGVGAQCTHKVAHDGPNGGLAAIVWFVGKFVLLN